jgi:diadenosine hexaphosphate hydrolase (ATP-forming)
MGKPTVSAGGILFRRKGNDVLIVIVEWEKGVEKKWAPVLRQLPKGGCKSSETLEQTALREVLEETGYKARIISKAGEAQWSYKRDEQVWDETVHYYFMKPLTLIAQEHDDEFDYVRWVKIEEATRILSYPEERELIFEVVANDSLPQ